MGDGGPQSAAEAARKMEAMEPYERELYQAGFNDDERRNILSCGVRVPLSALKDPASVERAFEELHRMAAEMHPTARLQFELRKLWWEITEALGIPQLVDWLARKLQR